MTANVPTLSLAAFAQGDAAAAARFANSLHEALARTGFVIIEDHGIDLSRLHEAYAAIEAFFALPEAQKAAHIVGEDGQRGYTAFGREHAKDNPYPDLKEFWHVGRDAIRPNVWPDEPAAFRPMVEWLYEALDRVGLTLLRALTKPLDLPTDYFEVMAAGGNSVLRLLHYPPIPEGADPNSVRAAAHEDINLITLLVSASAAGLELKDREGRWQSIEAAPDTIIVDAGDMLARITNDHIPATTHRVVNPDGPNLSRYSMPFFLHPRPQARLACLPQFRDGSEAADITAQDFLAQRLAEIGLA
jgi:isopenicillin N synthase-like dioxygenase